MNFVNFTNMLIQWPWFCISTLLFLTLEIKDLKYNNFFFSKYLIFFKITKKSFSASSISPKNGLQLGWYNKSLSLIKNSKKFMNLKQKMTKRSIDYTFGEREREKLWKLRYSVTDSVRYLSLCQKCDRTHSGYQVYHHAKIMDL